VRYVYQPVEGMYLVLVTNRQSNILEDLETLRLLAKLIPEYAPSLDEAGVVAGAFDLIFAFDEVIAMGHKENITLAQIRENVEMESHEERLHKMIMQSKMDDAKANMRKKALEIEKAKLERRAMGAIGAGPRGGGGAGPADPSAVPMALKVEDRMQVQPTVGIAAQVAAAHAARSSGVQDRKGASLQLGAQKGAQKGRDLGGIGVGRLAGGSMLDQLRAEGESVDVAPARVAGHSAAQQEAIAASHVASDPVSILVEERVSATLLKDGGCEGLEVQGQMALTVHDAAAAQLAVQLAGASGGFQFKTHPNIDKAAYSGSGVLQLRDPSRPFPLGTPLTVLKWRMAGTDESMLPLTVTAWPNPGAGETSMTLEYECPEGFLLEGVALSVPLPALERPPSILACDGETKWVSKSNALLWEVPFIDDDNRSGSMEFSVPGQVDTELFFPVIVSFSAKRTMCTVQVASVVGASTQEPVKHALRTVLSTDNYVIQ